MTAYGVHLRERLASLTQASRRCLGALVSALATGDSGQDMVEYALTAAVVVLGLLLALFGFQVVVAIVLDQMCVGVDTAAGIADGNCINPS